MKTIGCVLGLEGWKGYRWDYIDELGKVGGRRTFIELLLWIFAPRPGVRYNAWFDFKRFITGVSAPPL